jgi:hypothetical protein
LRSSFLAAAAFPKSIGGGFSIFEINGSSGCILDGGGGAAYAHMRIVIYSSFVGAPGDTFVSCGAKRNSFNYTIISIPKHINHNIYGTYFFMNSRMVNVFEGGAFWR